MGTLGRDLDRVFQAKVCGSWVAGSKRVGEDKLFNEEVTKFIRMYQGDRLFTKVPGRQHSYFPQFDYKLGVTYPGVQILSLHTHDVVQDLSTLQQHTELFQVFDLHQYSNLHTKNRHFPQSYSPIELLDMVFQAKVCGSWVAGSKRVGEDKLKSRLKNYPK